MKKKNTIKNKVRNFKVLTSLLFRNVFGIVGCQKLIFRKKNKIALGICAPSALFIIDVVYRCVS
ncbi:hypothetical protein D929_02696 [Enterococcus faecalis 02-MB-P-10]|nr:hypothetical protein D929_02696 [Enterococcus faecalis 02-MB-P-10]